MNAYVRVNGRGGRGARRLTVCLTLVVGGVAYGGPATAGSLPAIAADPQESTLAQFTLLDVWASNWENAPVVVKLNGTIVAEGGTDSSGTYVSGDIAVPSGVAVCGSNNVTWYNNDSSDANWVAGTSITVYCPTVQVTPNPVQATGDTYSITVSGSGFPPVRYVTFTLDGAQTSFGNTYADGNGNFSTAATIPAVPCGTHQVTATAEPPVIPRSVVHPRAASTVPQFQPLPASTTFSVVGCPTPSSSPTPSAPPPPPQRGPAKLTANPDVISDGMLTHVTDTGFPPSKPVTLFWTSATGTPLTVCSANALDASALTVGADGSIDTYCLVPSHEIFGAVQIVAVPGAATINSINPSSYHKLAAAPVVIEGGSMQPSSGDQSDQFVFRR